MIARVKKGDVVAITFDDHSRGNESIEFVVYGRVTRQSRKDITVAFWTYSDAKYKPAEDDANVHGYTIVRKAIRELVTLA